jgi:uncharacterized SAM-binding protein YcdF (DUF218 family)
VGPVSSASGGSRKAREREPVRRVAHRPAAKRKRRTANWRKRLVLLAITLLVGLAVWAWLARRLAPRGNTPLTHFDTIVVLGYPADGDGNPTPIELERVTEAVHEYERGVAAHLIFTGGAAHNQFVEAEVMARTAEGQGIPADAVVVEPKAQNTVENACYAVRLMKARGWDSAEVISSAWHLERAGLIFSRLPIAWRAHAAPALEPDPAWLANATEMLETLKTVRYLVWTRPMDQCAI